MKSPKPPTVAIVVPCYNEEAILAESNDTLLALLKQCVNLNLAADDSYLVYVDDGSKDKTWQIIQTLREREATKVRGVRLSRNFGHQAALLAGFQSAVADVYITIDADLQDDVNAIIEMLEAYLNGADIVFGIRNNRETDTRFKRLTAEGFYWLMEKIGVDILRNHADFRLMSSRSVQELMQFPERNVFLRALVLRLGFKSARVFYKRKPRLAGESKYPVLKMVMHAWNGIASSSVAPIRLIALFGSGVVIVSIMLIIYALWSYLRGDVLSGWPSLMITVAFLGGVQLLSIGVIGEYIGKVYEEVKRRPKFIIESQTDRPRHISG